jgi:hypothetical protein
MLTLGVAFGALFLGISNWWVAFIVGYGFVLPAVAMLERDDEEGRRNTDASTTPTSTSSTPTTADRTGRTDSTHREESKGDALETLRDRYARGELSEEQFEAKLERLLETETLEDARDTVDRSRRNRPDGARTTENERDRELEYE